jgi:flagellin FlaB
VIVQAATSTGTSTGSVGEIKFFLQLAAGGAPVDMQKVTFTVATAKEMKTYTYAGTTGVTHKWYAQGGEQSGANDMLEKFETVEIKIGVSDLGNNKIEPNDWFTVEVKPDVGAALPIKRVAPPDLQDGQHYEVF